MLISLLVACASKQAPKEPPPGPTVADKEISQLLATARRGEARWKVEAEEQRRLRQRVLKVSTAAGLALARKQLHGLANQSLLQVLDHIDGEPGAGKFVRNHPVTVRVVGQPPAIVTFLVSLEREAPKFRLGKLTLARRDDSAAYVATLEVDVLERIAVPPLLIPTPVTPQVPLVHEAAVRTLRAHIRQLDKALTAGRESRAQLETASLEVGLKSAPLSGPVAALFPKGSPTTVQTASFAQGKLVALGHAETEENARIWAVAVERHSAVSPGLVVAFGHEPLGDGRWTRTVELEGVISEQPMSDRAPTKGR